MLRRIDAGSFKMQGTTTTILSKSFYLGVFEMTEKQWSLVTGDSLGDGYYQNGAQVKPDTMPRICTYDQVRGSANGSKWPSSSAVDDSSFLGKLRARTKNNFDMPTEAQWEYACRAGTTTTYYWGNSLDGAYCWYNGNSPWPATQVVRSPVGKKKANAWGLYDMSGNAFEACLDWYGTLSYGTDPKGPASGTKRVRRGGCWYSGDTAHGYSKDELTSSERRDTFPDTANGETGFRLCLTIE